MRLTLSLLLLVAAAQAQDYERAFDLYKKWIKRPSLHKRTRAREILARTGDERALKILVKTYGRAEKPKDQVKYLCVAIASDNFMEEQHLAIYTQWRARYTKPWDAWLWNRALLVELDNRGPGPYVAVPTLLARTIHDPAVAGRPRSPSSS